MEKISIALARLERVKVLLESWRQKKSISNIERNIVLNQLSTLYDELLDANIYESKTVNNILSNAVLQKEPKEEKAVYEKVEAEPVKNEEKPVITEQTLFIEEKDAVTEDKPTQAKPSLDQERQDTTVRLADKFTGIHKYLFENFENQDGSGIARFSAIDDINRAIGINDRFLFIKELFNGDKDLFNKTISTLNACSSLDDALMYLHENYSWSSEDSVVKQLVLLLYRRFKQ